MNHTPAGADWQA